MKKNWMFLVVTILLAAQSSLAQYVSADPNPLGTCQRNLPRVFQSESVEIVAFTFLQRNYSETLLEVKRTYWNGFKWEYHDNVRSCIHVGENCRIIQKVDYVNGSIPRQDKDLNGDISNCQQLLPGVR